MSRGYLIIIANGVNKKKTLFSHELNLDLSTTFPEIKEIQMPKLFQPTLDSFSSSSLYKPNHLNWATGVQE